MARGNEFLLTPGPLPWRVDCTKRNPKNGAVYDAEGRLVCVAAIGNAREIVRMANLFKDCEVAKRESPAEGVQSQVLRNGETEARRAGVSQYPCRKRGRGVKPSQ